MVLTTSVMPPSLMTVLIKEVLMFSERRRAEDCMSISFLMMGLMMSERMQPAGALTMGRPVSLAARTVSSSSVCM